MKRNTSHGTEPRVVMSHTFIGPWREFYAPNGSSSSTGRILHAVEIVEADYYGQGPRLYVSGSRRIESQSGFIGPRHGSWQCGRSDTVASWVAAIREDSGITDPIASG